jgi:hypothetical protein
MSADDPLITAFVEQAGKTGLQQDAVQAVIDTMGPKVQEALTAPLVAWATYQTEQQAAVMADPEIGGAKWAESKAAIATLLGNPLVDPGLLPQLERSGMANNPEMLRTLVRLSKLVTEGGSVSAGNPPGGRKSPAQILYPKQS